MFCGVSPGRSVGCQVMSEPPPGWGNGAVHPEARALAEEHRAKGWIVDPTRKTNSKESFYPKWAQEPKARVLYLHGYGENMGTASIQISDMKFVLESAFMDVSLLEGFEHFAMRWINHCHLQGLVLTSLRCHVINAFITWIIA